MSQRAVDIADLTYIALRDTLVALDWVEESICTLKRRGLERSLEGAAVVKVSIPTTRRLCRQAALRRPQRAAERVSFVVLNTSKRRLRHEVFCISILT
ncbi:MAG: hypothetical protein U0136_11880 [Bdellovibrionota bacterium]